jgi:hypothetical protein
VHRFRYYDEERGLDLGGRTEIITIELKKTAGLPAKKAREMSPGELWAFFFRYASDRERRGRINEIMTVEEGIAMAGEELLTVSEEEKLQAWLMSAEKYDLDRQSDLVDARRDGYKEAKTEYQEQIRRLEEENRRLRGEQRGKTTGEMAMTGEEILRQAQEEIRRLEEENRRLRGERNL